MKQKNFLLLVTMAFVLTSLVGCNKIAQVNAVEEYDQRIVLRFAEFLPPEHPSAIASQEFANDVFEQTDGRIEIRVQYNSELGSEPEALEQLSFGGIAFARVSFLSLAQDVSALESYAVPFAYQTPNDALAALQENSDSISALLDKEQMSIVVFLTPDQQCLANNVHSVQTLTDLTDLRISAISSRSTSQFLTAVNVFPVAMEEGDVLRSLNNEYINGAMLGLLEYAEGNYSALMPQVTLLSPFNVPDVILVSDVSLGAINSKDQEIIFECGKAVFETHRTELENAQQQTLTNLEAAGIQLCDGKTLQTQIMQRLGTMSD